MAVCYLLHFDPPYKQARHYLGYTNFLKRRVKHHQNGTGARLTQVAAAAGSHFKIVRVWRHATRETERQLKRQRHNSRLCPLCNKGARKRGRKVLNTKKNQQAFKRAAEANNMAVKFNLPHTIDISADGLHWLNLETGERFIQGETVRPLLETENKNDDTKSESETGAAAETDTDLHAAA